MTSLAAETKAFDMTEEELADGFSAQGLFCGEHSRQMYGATFDDLIILPGSIDFGCHEVELTANVTKNIQLKLPFISSPMDTVTEHSMATAMALQGGMGVIHRNCTVEYQCGEVRSTKAHQNGFISNPMCVGPESTIEDLDALTYTAFPVTDTGAVGGKLLGIVTSRDIDFVVDRKSRCADVMTKFSDMVTVEEGITLDEARKVVVASKKGKVPVVNASGDIVSMISRRDIVLQQDFPDASQNKKEQLLVGAACGVDQPDDRERLDALAAMGVDVVVLDATQGHSTAQIEQLNYCKRAFPDIDVIAGNVVTEKQVRGLLDAGADGIRVGMGSGSVATGQQVKAVGRAQVSAIYHTARTAKEYSVPVIADGGIVNSGCIAKSLSMGASCVMMGSLLAGTEQSPGEYFFQDGMRLKKYHGSTSHDAVRRQRSASQMAALTGSSIYVSQGVSGSVADKGSIQQYIPYLAQSLRHGMQDMGASSIVKLHELSAAGQLRFELRTHAAQREGGVHDLFTFSKAQFA